MPSPQHPCTHPECNTMISARATYCRKHWIHTPEHIERQAATLRGKHHSAETRNKQSARRYSRIEVTCQQCGSTFRLKKGARNKKGYGQFCSSTCAYVARSGENSPFWQGGPVTHICDLCGNEVKRCRAYSKNHKHNFCSMSCKALYQMAHPKTRGTKIEIIMGEALAKAGYDFQPQIPLCKVTVVDFYSPTYNIAIYCDGDYWHRRPETIEKDQRQNAILRANGIVVLRFWEKEIKHDIRSCLRQLHSAIGWPVHQIPLPIW